MALFFSIDSHGTLAYKIIVGILQRKNPIQIYKIRIIFNQNLVFDQDNNFYWISLCILITCLLDCKIVSRNYRKKLHVSYFWE